MRRWIAISCSLLSSAAYAGPPYATDDPEPTETGHWEIYAFNAGTRIQGNYDGSAGLDLNYGPVEDLQLTATLPLDTGRDTGKKIVAGDLEIGVKYRFIHNENTNVAVAIFPRIILPTAAGDGGGQMRFLLPVWGQKDFGKWSIFGGGGYTVNPGAGNRDYWTQSVAVTREISQKLSLGAEVTHNGPDAIGAPPETALNFGGIYKLAGPFALLFSAGPKLAIDGNIGGFNGYVALSINF
jgi:hypothetical protein